MSRSSWAPWPERCSPTTFGRAGRTVLATLLLSLAAFGALATAGLPVLGRYLLLPAVLMIVLASAAVTGWTRVRAGGPARAVAQAVAVAVVAALLVLAPAQIGRLDRLRDTLSAQAHIAADLHELAEDRRLTGRCPQMGVPSRRVVAQLALWLERSASSFTVGDAHPKGTYLLPATLMVARLATLDPREPVPAMPRRPAGFRLLARTDTWLVLERCCSPSVTRPADG